MVRVAGAWQDAVYVRHNGYGKQTKRPRYTQAEAPRHTQRNCPGFGRNSASSSAQVVRKGLRFIVIFEGRDAAGKGRTIKAITERVSPRVFRVVALPPSSERKTRIHCVQRYMQHFPAAGEIVLFDRIWYNRAGVRNRKWGFPQRSSIAAYSTFARRGGKIHHRPAELCMLKFWLEVGNKKQKQRVSDAYGTLRQWKLSPMDSRSRRRCSSRERDLMLDAEP